MGHIWLGRDQTQECLPQGWEKETVECKPLGPLHMHAKLFIGEKMPAWIAKYNPPAFN